MVDGGCVTLDLASQAVEIAPGVSVKLEGVLRSGTAVYVVVSCSSKALDFSLRSSETGETVALVARDVLRPGSSDGGGLRVFKALSVPTGELSLEWRTSSGGSGRSKAFPALAKADHALFRAVAPVLLEDLANLKVGSQAWQQLKQVFPERASGATWLRGRIEYVRAVVPGLGAVVAGWEVHRDGAVVWLEDGDGRCYDLRSAYRYGRPDVQAVVQLTGYGSPDSGFKAYAPGLGATGPYRLCAAGLQGLESNSCADVGLVEGSTRELARTIFGLTGSPYELLARAQCFDWPLLDRAIERQCAAWQRWEPRTWTAGDLPPDPKVSVVVPLYGRTDLVEHQLIEFSRDADFQELAELIYVIDDPKILDHFSSLVGEMYGRYGVPFRWIWGHENRGFAGANNLGAEFARGQHLLFMNSDVIPIAPGWVSKLLAELDERPAVGAVGPRLLFAGGGIQHAGMRPVWNDRLGIWHNQHIMMGFDPVLDLNSGLTEVPLITGACLMLRRSDFDAIGGWDTGYLIGDYEDSELCMRLRERGQSVAYLPEVDLVHLERQSFKEVGDGQFRQRVTHLNAVRYRERWNEALQAMCGAGES